MGKIRVKTLGDEEFEKEQAKAATKRREEKKIKKEHTKGVGLKGGQQVTAMEGVELTAEAREAVAEIEGSEDGKAAKKSKKIKVHTHSKRYTKLRGLVEATKLYPIKEAITLVKKTSNTKFDGSVELHININPAVLTKEKKNVSGSVRLPHGTGKKRVIAIADEALIERVTKGTIDFDILVAHPSLMPKLARIAKILGPKGLMPNPKNGTVNQDPEKRAKELEGGELNWKSEADQPLIHQIIGKVSFTEDQLQDNIKAFLTAVNANKVSKMSINATMGPGIKVDLGSL